MASIAEEQDLEGLWDDAVLNAATKDEVVATLLEIKKLYPAVYRNFFMSRLIEIIDKECANY